MDLEKATGFRIYQPGVQVLEGDPDIPEILKTANKSNKVTQS